MLRCLFTAPCCTPRPPAYTYVCVCEQVLRSALAAYRARHEAGTQEPDEMITSAGDYLMHVLLPVQQAYQRTAWLLIGVGAAAVVAGCAVFAQQLQVGCRGPHNDGGGGAAAAAAATDRSRLLALLPERILRMWHIM